MPNPIIQLIADEVVNRLGNILKGNGYEFDVAFVLPVSRDTNTFHPSPRGIYVKQQAEAENEELSCPGNPPAVAYDVVFEITGYANQIDTDTTEPAIVDDGATVNNMLASIQKAIANNDAAHWHEFDGNSLNATMPVAETMETADYDGAKVELIVTYRTSEIDPYALRGA